MPKTADALAALYAKRRAIVAKEKSDLAFSLNQPIKTLFCTFRITILPKTFLRVEIWFFTIVHSILFALKLYGVQLFSTGTPGEWALPLSFSAVAISSGFMSLLLVFFNSQCYARYQSLYQACTGMAGSVQELAQITSVHLARASPEARWDACRYLVSSVFVVYMRVTDMAANRPPTVDEEDWQRLTRSEEEWLGEETKVVKMPPLLRHHEVEQLKKCAGRELQVLQMWALQTVHAAYLEVGAEQHFREVEEIVLATRKNCAAIPNMLDMPVPFPYYHALCGLMFVNYGLYTVTFLEINSYLTPLALFLVCGVTTAVRELSSAIANPFGDDEVDFNSSRFMNKLRGIVTFLAHPVNAATYHLALPEYLAKPEERPRRAAPPFATNAHRAPPPAPSSAFEVKYEPQPRPPAMGYEERANLERSVAEQAVEVEHLRVALEHYDNAEAPPYSPLYSPQAPPPPPPPQPPSVYYEPPPHSSAVYEAERTHLERSLAEQAQQVEQLRAALEHAPPAPAQEYAQGPVSYADVQAQLPQPYPAAQAVQPPPYYYAPVLPQADEYYQGDWASQEGVDPEPHAYFAAANPQEALEAGNACVAEPNQRRERRRFRQPFQDANLNDACGDSAAANNTNSAAVMAPPTRRRGLNVRAGADLGPSVLAQGAAAQPAPKEAARAAPVAPLVMRVPAAPPAPVGAPPAPAAPPPHAPPPPPAPAVAVMPAETGPPVEYDPEAAASAASAAKSTAASAAAQRMKTLPLPSYKPEEEGEDGKVRWRVAPM